MVQDLLNPEYYVGAFQAASGQWVTSKFCDPDIPEDTPQSATPTIWERRPVVLVPVPGLSSWALPAVPAVPAKEAQATEAFVETGIMEPAQAQPQPVQQPAQQQPTRAKRERSSDADAQHDSMAAAASAGGAVVLSPRGVNAATAAAPAAPSAAGESMSHDTELSDDQGLGPSGAAAGGAGSPGEAEGATRPRVRRREDPTAGLVVGDTGAASDRGAPVPTFAPATAAATGCDACAGGHACGQHPAGADAAAQQSQAPGEVPGSCIVYLYDNAPALPLHEVVEVVGVLSHMPQLAQLEYDNQDPLLAQELASLGLDADGSGNGRSGSAPTAGSDAATMGDVAERGVRAAQGERLAFEAIRAAHPPTSKVMRLHAILVHRQPDLVPALPAAGAAAATEVAAGAAPAAAPAAVADRAALRVRALALLRWALGGDGLAAEYVLLQLLSRVVNRGDPNALGQLALNISRCPGAVPCGASAPPAPSVGAAAAAASTPAHSSPALAAELLAGRGVSGFASALQAAVSCLVPLSVALPLSVEGCNSLSWSPVRDVSRERTAPSPLQLAPGTVLLLDETVMAPGQLNSQGVVSMQALLALARQQELLYDFETFQHPVPLDLPLIVLTQGRSLLRDCLPLRLPLTATQPFPSAKAVLASRGCPPAADSPNTSPPTSSGGAAAAPNAAAAAAGAGIVVPMGDGAAGASAAEASASAAGVDDVALTAVRSYLAAARAEQGYELAEGMAQVLEQWFVGQRRAAQAQAQAQPHQGQQQGRQQGGAAEGGMTPEEFHMKLTLARLLVMSYGEKQLTRERWQQLLQMEHTREARLRVVG
ncbi:hypothetical protein HYH02_005759 [Chlamydomonas schloesseri]|uniref:Mini-chromosome maintenance complex-binding protein n=1 Tax=Chlamydomonas schloesseri TaxID=2026947 RepID=A0A835WKA5_9CHLO|nr:hypothetical protein HYH02_005759 [Chlamydomonas schloesseri]|eukprot:KAG2449005.1 hypothetical protein HYH02_005759 [Chlamydomonas schloesseri]